MYLRKKPSKFSPETIKSIGCYVYILVDPRGNVPFYVGKGSGNRVYSHVNSVLKNGPTPGDPKEAYIDSILKRSTDDEVIHYIVRYGLTPEHALLIESVLIDIFNHKLNINLNSSGTLTNIYGGFYSDNVCESIGFCYAKIDLNKTIKPNVLHRDIIYVNFLYDGRTLKLQDDAAGIYTSIMCEE